MKSTDRKTKKVSASPKLKPRAEKLDQAELFKKILALMTKHDPSSLTYSSISRQTGVPRPTLYYYFGPNKADLIHEAVKYGMDAFTQIYKIENDFKQFPDWHTFQKARFLKALRMIALNPWAPPLYFRYRTHGSEWGVLIREMEGKYSQHLASVWERFQDKKVSQESVRFVTYIKLGVLWGMAAESELWFKEPSRMEYLANHLTHLVSDSLHKMDIGKGMRIGGLR